MCVLCHFLKGLKQRKKIKTARISHPINGVSVGNPTRSTRRSSWHSRTYTQSRSAIFFFFFQSLKVCFLLLFLASCLIGSNFFFSPSWTLILAVGIFVLFFRHIGRRSSRANREIGNAWNGTNNKQEKYYGAKRNPWEIVHLLTWSLFYCRIHFVISNLPPTFS